MGNDKAMGRGTAVAYDLIRQQVPFLNDDTTLAPLIETARRLVASGQIKEAIEARLDGED
jgi:histidine ammonia-lyase